MPVVRSEEPAVLPQASRKYSEGEGKVPYALVVLYSLWVVLVLEEAEVTERTTEGNPSRESF